MCEEWQNYTSKVLNTASWNAENVNLTYPDFAVCKRKPFKVGLFPDHFQNPEL